MPTLIRVPSAMLPRSFFPRFIFPAPDLEFQNRHQGEHQEQSSQNCRHFPILSPPLMVLLKAVTV